MGTMLIMMLNEMLLLELENVLPFTCAQMFLSMPPSLQGERARRALCSWPLLWGSAGSGLPAASWACSVCPP